MLHRYLLRIPISDSLVMPVVVPRAAPESVWMSPPPRERGTAPSQANLRSYHPPSRHFLVVPASSPAISIAPAGFYIVVVLPAMSSASSRRRSWLPCLEQLLRIILSLAHVSSRTFLLRLAGASVVAAVSLRVGRTCLLTALLSGSCLPFPAPLVRTCYIETRSRLPR